MTPFNAFSAVHRVCHLVRRAASHSRAGVIPLPLYPAMHQPGLPLTSAPHGQFSLHSAEWCILIVMAGSLAANLLYNSFHLSNDAKIKKEEAQLAGGKTGVLYSPPTTLTCRARILVSHLLF